MQCTLFSVLGFEVESRAQLDKTAYQLIVPNPRQGLERAGLLKSWQLYAKQPGRIMLMVRTGVYNRVDVTFTYYIQGCFTYPAKYMRT